MESLDLSDRTLERLTSSSKAGKVLMERALSCNLVELYLPGNQLQHVPELLLEAW